MTQITIVGFGDSITESVVDTPDIRDRWLTILNERLSAQFPASRFKVINAGVGGNSDREKMARFDRDVLANNPDYLLVEFGGNNSDFRNPERLVSVRESEQLLRQLRQRLPAQCQIVVITFPRVLDQKHAAYFCGGNQETMDKYHACFRQEGGCDKHLNSFRDLTIRFARENNFPLVDLYLAMLEQDPSGEIFTQNDGVHLTKSGNILLANLVFTELESPLTFSRTTS